jgi:hypothetical protein
MGDEGARASVARVWHGCGRGCGHTVGRAHGGGQRASLSEGGIVLDLVRELGSRALGGQRADGGEARSEHRAQLQLRLGRGEVVRDLEVAIPLAQHGRVGLERARRRQLAQGDVLDARRQARLGRLRRFVWRYWYP